MNDPLNGYSEMPPVSVNSRKRVGGPAVHKLPDRAVDLGTILRILPQPDSRQGVAWRYGGAVLVTLGFIAARWLLGRVIDDGVPFATLFIPIALSAFYGGLGPGIV